MILLLMACMGLPVWAAEQAIHHLTISAGGGYSGLMNSYQNSRYVGGGGGLIGIGYELRYGHLILDAGAEYRLLSSADKIRIPGALSEPVTGEEQPLTIHYTFADPLTETNIIGQGVVPLMIGGHWDTWYFLAGTKIGYTLHGSYAQRGNYTTTLTDPEAYDPNWADIPVHGAFTDVPYHAGGKTRMGADVTVSAEIGMNIGQLIDKHWEAYNRARRHPLHLRLALFADYGVWNMQQPSEGAFVSLDQQGLHTRSLHCSDWNTGKLNSLLVGIKFTALIQMNKPRKAQPVKSVCVLQVKDSTTLRPIASAVVELRYEQGGHPRTIRRYTGQRGTAPVKLAAGEYDLRVTHPEYFPVEQSFTHAAGVDTIAISLAHRPDVPQVQQMAVDTTETNERTIVLDNMFFAIGKTSILPGSEQALQELYEWLMEHPTARMLITGHTDNVGSAFANQRLSEGRARAVREDLIRRGISPERIEAVGKGEAEPITSNATEEGRALNRRVEFTIIASDDDL